MDYYVSEGNRVGRMPTEFGATGNQLVEKVIVAQGAITKGQLLEVGTADFTVKAAAANSAKVVGIAMFDAADGKPVTYQTEGLVKVNAGSAVTVGASLSAGANGTVVPQTAGTPGTSFPSAKVGIALNAATTGNPVFFKFMAY